MVAWVFKIGDCYKKTYIITIIINKQYTNILTHSFIKRTTNKTKHTIYLSTNENKS